MLISKVLVLLLYYIEINLSPVSALCNVYPKIFGDETSNVIFYDIEIHEGTDVIVSSGEMSDPSIFPTASNYPLIVVHSLSTIAVKWAITDKTKATKQAIKVTISPNGKYIASNIGGPYHLIVFYANNGTAISSREYL